MDGAPSTSLTTSRVEEARVLLAQALEVDDVLELRDKADAMRLYWERRDVASQAHADAWEIVQHANRRAGELLSALPKLPGGRPKKGETVPPSGEVSKSAQLKQLGISSQQASRLEELASLPETEFRARVELQRGRLMKQADPSEITATTSASDHDGDAWGTPPKYVEPGRIVLGGIELDPATNERAQGIVRAERFFTVEQNGLSQEWKARTVWLNPPYSEPLISQFAHRWCDEFQAGHFSAGLLLVNACMEVSWMQRALAFAAVCFPKERIAFLGADGNPVKGNSYRQAILYAGPKLPLFRKTYEPLGRVLVSA